jgi:peroxiredoxin
MLRIGDKAPAFALPAEPGQVVDVGKHLGREPVVLLFFPLAFSPVCTKEMCHFRDAWAQWQGLPARLFGISVDSPFVTQRFRAEERIPFPLLSDFNKDVARQYGVLHEELKGLRGVAKRSAFVVDAAGRIGYAWSTDDPTVQVDFAAIRAAIDKTAATKAR